MVSVFAVSMTMGTPDSSRICAADVDAVLAGQHEIEQHEIGFGLAECRQRTIAVSTEDGLEALVAQDDAEHLRKRRVVVDDEYASLHGPHRCINSYKFTNSTSTRIRPVTWKGTGEVHRRWEGL